MFGTKAHCLWHNGYSPIPLQSDRSPFKGWSERCTTPMTLAEIDKIDGRYKHLGIGVAGGYNGLVPLDVDTDDEAIWNVIRGVMPSPNVMKKGSKGLTAFYRSHDTIPGQKFCLPPPDAKPMVEVLTTGVVTIPPTMHPKTNSPYRWVKGSLYETRINELVVITPEHIQFLRVALEPFCPARKFVSGPTVSRALVDDKRMRTYAERVVENEVIRLTGIRGGRNQALFRAASRLGKFMHHGILPEREIADALMNASRANGYTKTKGEHHARSTIRSGLAFGHKDQLPDLDGR